MSNEQGPSMAGSAAGSAAPLWHGRFDQGPADELWAFTVSLPFDRRLAMDDIAGSRAHVKGLARVGLISAAEEAAVLDALDHVEREMAGGSFTFLTSRGCARVSIANPYSPPWNGMNAPNDDHMPSRCANHAA